MAGQEQINPSNEDRTPDDDAATPAPAAAAAQKDDDEVDALLETNAESFGRGFVQKGGQ
jgi:ubiquitin-like protein Pup